MEGTVYMRMRNNNKIR